MRSVLLILIVSFSLTPVGPGAMAQTGNVPPGQSAIDEYLETVPDGGGNIAPGAKPDLKQPEVASGAAANLPAQTLRALKRSGTDGRAAAALAAGASPAAAGARPSPLPPPGAASGSDGLLPTVGRAATGTDGGGFGALYPALLIAILIGAVAVAVVRRRRGSASA